MKVRQFPRDEKLTAIAIAYSNPDNAMVADAVLPRKEVGLEDFAWTSYPTAQSFTVPDTRIGDKGKAVRIELTGTKVTSSTEDEAIEIPVTNKDIAAAPAGVDPKGSATEHATKLLLLRREVRTAAAVLDPTVYAASNKKDLATLDSGAHAWDESTSNPLVDLRTWLNGMMMRGNILAMGPDAWLALSQHPKVVSACLGNDGTNGFASKEAICKQLEIKDILVGAGWVNANKPGAAVSLTRVWGPHCLAMFQDSTASFSNKAVTFGLTAQFGDRVAAQIEIPVGQLGLKGGVAVLTGESVKELVIAADCGFLIQNVLGA